MPFQTEILMFTYHAVLYFMVLVWVIGATVMAKLLAPLLIDVATGPLKLILSWRIEIPLTGDRIILDFFEEGLLASLNARLLLELAADLLKPATAGVLVPVPVEAFVLQKILVPEKYWSGCPPDYTA
jgi:hypothetical protein